MCGEDNGQLLPTSSGKFEKSGEDISRVEDTPVRLGLNGLVQGMGAQNFAPSENQNLGSPFEMDRGNEEGIKVGPDHVLSTNQSGAGYVVEDEIESPNFSPDMRSELEGSRIRLGDDQGEIAADEGDPILTEPAPIQPELPPEAMGPGISLFVDLNDASYRKKRRRQVLTLASSQEAAEFNAIEGEGFESTSEELVPCSSSSRIEEEVRATMEVGAALGILLSPQAEIVLKELIQSDPLFTAGEQGGDAGR